MISIGFDSAMLIEVDIDLSGLVYNVINFFIIIRKNFKRAKDTGMQQNSGARTRDQGRCRRDDGRGRRDALMYSLLRHSGHRTET